MKSIGLDLSINSTGICICRNGKPIKYYIITNNQNLTKKKLSMIPEVEQNTPLKYIIYDKHVTNSKLYSEKESAKSFNINVISDSIELIIKKEKPDLVFIEGISYGSTGSAALVDLSGLNFAIRRVLYKLKVKFIVVAPTEVKKNACGNGAAHKDEMIYAWEACDKRLKKYREQLKFDDLADAYFLAKTPIEVK